MFDPFSLTFNVSVTSFVPAYTSTFIVDMSAIFIVTITASAILICCLIFFLGIAFSFGSGTLTLAFSKYFFGFWQISFCCSVGSWFESSTSS